jgi:hypothetical protein
VPYLSQQNHSPPRSAAHCPRCIAASCPLPPAPFGITGTAASPAGSSSPTEAPHSTTSADPPAATLPSQRVCLGTTTSCQLLAAIPVSRSSSRRLRSARRWRFIQPSPWPQSHPRFAAARTSSSALPAQLQRRQLQSTVLPDYWQQASVQQTARHCLFPDRGA